MRVPKRKRSGGRKAIGKNQRTSLKRYGRKGLLPKGKSPSKRGRSRSGRPISASGRKARSRRRY